MLHQIGVGALGPVFRTYEPTRDRLVAVKVFRLDVTPEQAGALAAELGRATEAGLFHPSIVEPVAAGLEGTVAYRAEEYVAAESLDVAMRHYAPAALDKALPFITQLAAAIDIARAAGVGHGALHPRDIFVTPDEARATGFGVVDALERLGLRAPVRRPYSAPERIAGQAWSTPADVFSLGAIAFELLTGRRPAGAGDQIGSLNGGVGPHADAIRAVLARAIAEDPSARFTTAGAFAAALTAAAQTGAPPAEVTQARPDERAALPIVAAVASDSADAQIAPQPDAAVEIDAADDDAQDARAADDESLDVFAAEPPNASAESPREAARKAIAARKRQARPKPEPVKTEAPKPPEPKIEAEPAEPLTAAAVDVEAPARDVEAPARKEAGFPVASLADVDLWHLDPVTTKGPDVSPADVEPEMPAVAAALRTDDDEHAVDAPLRDEVERVVTVDEFRAREASSPRVEKTWPRASDRPMPSIAPVSRGVPPPPAAKLLETNDVPLVPADEPEAEPQRFAMMPIAVGLLLGLLLGYGGGYFVGWRRGAADTTTQLAQNAAAQPATDSLRQPPLSTPGTSGQSREFSEQPVTPSGGRTATPNPQAAAPQRTPPAASTAAAKPPATAAVTPSRPAPVPAPSKPAVVSSTPAKPAPKPAATGPAARASGTILVKSSPAKAAVTVNGRWTGRTPLTLENREFGEYTIRVVEPGYDVAREVFRLSASAPSKTIDVVLKPSAGAKPPAAKPETQAKPQPPDAAAKAGATATGGLFVDSRPQGAKVIVNGKPAGVTPLRLNDQPVGAYEIRLELADHQPWTATARVVGGGTARVTGSMERIR